MIREFIYNSVTEGEYSVLADISEEINKAIEEFERKERNYERKKRYHRVLSLDSINCEKVYNGEEDILTFLEKENAIKELLQQLKNLPDSQRRRVQMKIDGLSNRMIAEIEGVSDSAICQSIKFAQETLTDFYKRYLD